MFFDNIFFHIENKSYRQNIIVCKLILLQKSSSVFIIINN